MVELGRPPVWATGGVTLPAMAGPVSERQRDLFPLPGVSVETPRSGVLSKTVYQRVCRRHRRQLAADATVAALNDLAAGGPANSVEPPTAAQKDALSTVLKRAAVAARLPPCTVEEAVNELLSHSHSYTGEEASSTVVAYDKALVSIPAVGATPPQVAEVLDPKGREFFVSFHEHLLRSSEDWGNLCERSDPVRPYMDTRLRSNVALYESFVADLWDRNMIKFTTQPADIVTPFFVKKKDGRQRLVWDCRVPNRRFRDPPPLATATGATWATLQYPDSSSLFVAQSDLKDYFYHLAIPGDLSEFFCLPPVSGALLARLKVPSSLLKGPISAFGEFQVWPMLAVVPMGWNWAMWLANRIHAHQALIGSGLQPSRLLVDHTVAPDLSRGEPVLLPYCDNLNVAGTDKQRVAQALDGATARLRSLGFVVHEVSAPALHATSLGYVIDGSVGVVRPRPERLAKVVRACQWLTRRPRIYGWQLERLLGHVVHIVMIQRSYLSILRALYDFVYHSYNSRCRLWASAAREAALLATLLPSIEAALSLPWSNRVYITDASLTGLGVGSRLLESARVAGIGGISERSRFRAAEPVRHARSNALGHLAPRPDPFADPSTVKPTLKVVEPDPYEPNPDFQEVPVDILESESWKTHFGCRVYRAEPIGILESRGVLAGIKHRVRRRADFCRRCLHLSDNMSVVLAFSKGRCSNFVILACIRRTLAHEIATNCQFLFRWVPSERNAMDKASRRYEPASPQPYGFRPPPGLPAPSHLAHEAHGGGATARRRTCVARCGELGGNGAPQLAGGHEVREGGEEAEGFWHVPLGGHKGRHFDLGGGLGLGEHSSPLPEFPSELLEFLPRKRPLLERPRVCRQRDGRLPVFPVPRGVGRPHGQLHVRGLDLGSPYVRQERSVPPTQNAQGLARVAQTNAELDKATDALVTSSARDLPPHRVGGAAVGHDPSVDVRWLPPTKRGDRSSGQRPRFSDARKPSLRDPSARSRLRGDQQGGGDERKHAARLPDTSVAGGGTRRVPGEQGGGKAVQLKPPGGQHPLHECAEGAGVHGVVRSVPNSPRRALSRLPLPSERTSRDQAPRAVVGGCLFGAVRSTRSSSKTRAQGDARRAAAGRPCSSEPKVGGPQRFGQKAVAGAKTPGVLEIFSGSANFCKACAKQGFWCEAWDLEYGTACDLTYKPNLEALIGRIRVGEFSVVLIATPCSSWSRARRSDGRGPGPLRDDTDFLWSGLPGLSLRDQERIQNGNKLVLISTRLAREAIAAGAAVILENPSTSRLWLTKPILSLISRGVVVKTHFCQYNCPWKKATKFLVVNAGSPGLLTCMGARGVCSRTNKHHIHLKGRDPTGVFWTHRAQPYPTALCDVLARHLRAAITAS
jgi:hypothetical protein